MLSKILSNQQVTNQIIDFDWSMFKMVWKKI
jgi:hypothetical protein